MFRFIHLMPGAPIIVFVIKDEATERALRSIKRQVKKLRREIRIMGDELTTKVDEQALTIAELASTLTDVASGIKLELQQVVDAVNQGSVDREAVRAAAERIGSHNDSLRSAVESLKGFTTVLASDDPPEPPQPAG